MLPVLLERGGVLLWVHSEGARERRHAASAVGEGWRALECALREC